MKSKLNLVRVSESQFADDVALYASNRTSLESVAKTFVEEVGKWGPDLKITLRNCLDNMSGQI